MEPEKEEKTKHKANGRNKIRTVITKIETRKTIEKTNKAKSWLSKKINKIERHLSRVIKGKKDTNN